MLRAGKDRIELLLALGASRWEAVQAAVQRCTRIALTPIINQMNVVRSCCLKHPRLALLLPSRPSSTR